MVLHLRFLPIDIYHCYTMWVVAQCYISGKQKEGETAMASPFYFMPYKAIFCPSRKSKYVLRVFIPLKYI